MVKILSRRVGWSVFKRTLIGVLGVDNYSDKNQLEQQVKINWGFTCLNSRLSLQFRRLALEQVLVHLQSSISRETVFKWQSNSDQTVVNQWSNGG